MRTVQQVRNQAITALTAYTADGDCHDSQATLLDVHTQSRELAEHLEQEHGMRLPVANKIMGFCSLYIDLMLGDGEHSPQERLDIAKKLGHSLYYNEDL